MSDPGVQRRQAIAMNEAAAVQWAEAIREHVMAPPDPGFSGRLRKLADAARTRARAARVADAAGLRWVARPGALRSQPPYELRPGTGRAGPVALWERFDGAVKAYNAAIAGTSARAVGDGAEVLAEVAEVIADALEADQGQSVGPARRESPAESSVRTR